MHLNGASNIFEFKLYALSTSLNTNATKVPRPFGPCLLLACLLVLDVWASLCHPRPQTVPATNSRMMALMTRAAIQATFSGLYTSTLLRVQQVIQAERETANQNFQRLLQENQRLAQESASTMADALATAVGRVNSQSLLPGAIQTQSGPTPQPPPVTAFGGLRLQPPPFAEAPSTFARTSATEPQVSLLPCTFKSKSRHFFPSCLCKAQ